MKAWLLTKDAILCSISLISEDDGSHTYSSDQPTETLPLHFDFQDGIWYCAPRHGAILEEMSLPVIGREGADAPEAGVALRDGSVIKIMCGTDLYLLYVESGDSEHSAFFAYRLDRSISYKIGTGQDCQIRYNCPCISRNHAQLAWTGKAWEIVDSGSAIGVYVNRERIDSRQLQIGDTVFIMGLYLMIGAEFIAINSEGRPLELDSYGIQRISESVPLVYPPSRGTPEVRGFFERQPRKRVRFYQETIEIEPPPMPMTANKIPMLLRLGSPMLMGGRALATGNVTMAMTSLLLPVLTQGFGEKERKEYEAKRTEGYGYYLRDKREEIQQEKLREEKRLNDVYPYLTEATRFAMKKERLWERRRGDDDFLSVRIGTGQFPLMAKREYPPRHLDLEPDPLEQKMYALAEEPVMLKNVPILLSLKTDYIVGIPGYAKRVTELVRGIILHLVLTHSYDEVKIVLLTNQKNGKELDYVRYLPHNWDNDRSIRFFGCTPTDTLRIGEYLSKEFEEYRNNTRKDSLRQRPAYVVFALDKDLFDRVEVLKAVMAAESYYGISVVAAFDGVPKDCKKLIELRGEPRLIDLVNMDVEDQIFAPDPYDAERAAVSARELMQTKLMAGSEAYLLPGMVTFLEMYGVGMVENLNIRENWSWDNKRNNPIKSLAAPIGIGTDGELFTLDLHEKFHGPHGLVAGTTGSGKSEFLITYILSMSVLYRPDEVSFILIDYKGGGLTDAFIDKNSGVILPHLAGTITNLDGSSIQRCLVSIDSEIKRREGLFREAKAQWNEGKMEIYDYQRLYREKKVSEPLSHLFIIADEFAELRDQQPKFLDKLISVARVGRSLGIHLILATQKPGGVVNKQMWSNMKTHVCLRVQEREDSMEMLQRPEASELRHTGRFYLQVGNNDYFGMGQSAWCGADYYPQKEVAVEKDESVQFLSNTGDELLSLKPRSDRKKAEFRQLVVIVKELSETGDAMGLHARQLWDEPLAAELEMLDSSGGPVFHAKAPREEVISTWPMAAKLLRSAKTGKPPEDFLFPALIGMVDDPEGQQQFPLYLDLMQFFNFLLIGEAGSGKSTFLRTLIYSLLNYKTPDGLPLTPEDVTFYILDLSSGVLGDARTLPHCGAYLTEKNESDINRLFHLLHDMIEERKAKFLQEGVSGYREYRKTHRMPLILVIVDGFSNITTLKDGSSLQATFHEYLREGTNYGVRYLLTANHLNELSARSKQELDYRIALQAKDRYVYTDILSCKCSFEPAEGPGRGVCVLDERPLEYQTAMVENWKESLAALSASCGTAWGNWRARQLTMPDTDQTYDEFCETFQTGRIPLGYARKDMRAVAMPLKQLYHASLYFGNPAGAQTIFQNLVKAATFNGMDILIVRRQTGSVFNLSESDAANEKITVLNSSAADLPAFYERIKKEIQERNVHRDAYCREQGLPEPYNGMAVRAAGYIRSHTVPLLVILERFYDLCLAENAAKEDGTSYEHDFSNFFLKMRGYNVYFAAGFYPEDPKEGQDALTSQPIAKNFNLDQFLLLFGGQFDKYAGTGSDFNLASKYKKVIPEINRFTLKYSGEFHAMIMPCGKLEQEDSDPDDAPIL